jgi:hypothetical protein
MGVEVAAGFARPHMGRRPSPSANELILGMSGMKGLVTVGAISEFAGGNGTNFLHTAGMVGRR